MKKKQLISWAFLSLLTAPIFLGCSQDYENEEFNGQEFETLTTVKRTRAAEAPQTPTVDFTDKLIEAGSDTITIGYAIPVEVVIVWSEGYIKRSDPTNTYKKSVASPSKAWVKSPNTGDAHIEVANLQWDLFDGHIYGSVQIKGSYCLTGGGGNYQLDFERPVNFTPKHIIIKTTKHAN